MLASVTIPGQLELFGRVIEPLTDFRSEVLSSSGIAGGVKYIDDAYLDSISLPHMIELAFKNEHYRPSPEELRQRSGFLPWLTEGGPLGEVCPELSNPRSPNPSFRHSFSPFAYRGEALTGGTTHVAVGFVDLSALLHSDLLESEDDEPLRFVGFDPSPYAVAKSLVVWEMLRSPAVTDDLVSSVAQVWFSSTWNSFVSTHFFAGLAAVEASLTFASLDSRVRRIIQHWRRSGGVSLEIARGLWISSRTRGRSRIASLAQSRDRIEIGRYELTGDFCLQGDPQCGNITFFDCPAGALPAERNESVFDSVPMGSVAEILDVSLFRAAELQILAGIQKMRKWAVTNLVTVELNCHSVESVAEQIKALRPKTVSWSNLDQFDGPSFHRLARRCSAKGTIHFGFSVDWIRRVRGTFLLDYRKKEERQYVLESSAADAARILQQYADGKRFIFPIRESPVNRTCQFLGAGYHKLWVENWRIRALESGFCKIGLVEYARQLASPLWQRGGTNVHLTWTYDPAVSFAGVCRAPCPNITPGCDCEPTFARDVLCRVCASVSYCSENCLQADIINHSFICALWKQVLPNG